MQEAALHELTQQYGIQLTENPLLAELKSRLEGSLLRKQTIAKRDSRLPYNEVLSQLHQVKRNELARLRQQDDLDEEVLRKIEAQLDLEEEKNDPSIR